MFTVPRIVLVLVLVLVLEVKSRCGVDFWRQVPRKVFVPKGPDDSSDSTELAEVLAVYCLGMRKKPNRPVRERYDWVGGNILRP
jgi:hypothetical protein